MPSEIFSLSYDGDEISNGEMDVASLGPALIAMGELFSICNELLNGAETLVQTKVKADFKEGSFEIFYSISQILHDPNARLFGSMYVLGSDNLVSRVVGKVAEKAVDKVTDKATEGVFALLAKLQGKRPETSTYDERRNVYIFNTGDNNQFVVDQPTGTLYRSPRVRQAAAKVAAPLARPGMKKMVAKRNKEAVATLGKEDIPELELPEMLTEPLVISTEDGGGTPRTLIVKILKPSFLGGKWSVSDGSQTFSVLVLDHEFVAKIHARQVGFYDGDLYKVEMVTLQSLVGGRLRTTRIITHVVASIPFSIQQNLPGVASPPQTARRKKKQ